MVLHVCVHIVLRYRSSEFSTFAILCSYYITSYIVCYLPKHVVQEMKRGGADCAKSPRPCENACRGDLQNS